MKRFNYKAKAIKFDDEGLPGLEMAFDGRCSGENKAQAEDQVRKNTYKDMGMYVVSISSKLVK